jgi:hypothetical protein
VGKVLIEQQFHCCGYDPESPLSIGSKCQARSDILGRQIRKVDEDLIRGHSRSQILEHVPHGDAQSTDARLAAPLIRLDGN